MSSRFRDLQPHVTRGGRAQASAPSMTVDALRAQRGCCARSELPPRFIAQGPQARDLGAIVGRASWQWIFGLGLDDGREHNPEAQAVDR